MAGFGIIIVRDEPLTSLISQSAIDEIPEGSHFRERLRDGIRMDLMRNTRYTFGNDWHVLVLPPARERPSMRFTITIENI
jgi:hypothetical protein